MSDAPSKLRIGVLGAANIARSFITALRGSLKVDVCAVASRDAAKGAAFAKEMGVAQSFASYESMLSDPSIEAIYNPLPNNLHAEWSIKAVNAGKHVLCEKPLAAKSVDAVAMFAAARANDVYLVEAYPYRAQPQTIKLAELVRNHAVGRVQTVQASFGFPLVAPSNIRWDPSLAGGALMDAGCYPLSLVRLVAGERPVRALAMAQLSESGVDRTFMGTLEFASGLIAQISCSFGTARHRRALIVGDVGTIDTTYFNDTGAEFPPLVHVTRGSGWDAARESIECAATPGFFAQGEAFHDLVRHGWGAWPGATPAESIDIALALEALAASARTGTAVRISQTAM